MIRGKLVRTLTPDQLELSGFIISPEIKSEVAFLFIHGMYENFYLPLFVQLLYEILTANGYAFLTANTRAHDYLIHCRKWHDKKSFTWETQGGVREIFSNCIYDIEGWLKFLEKNGWKHVVIIGHSHGALKAAYFAINRQNEPRLNAICLISPSDDVGIQKCNLDKRYDDALVIARKMVSNGRGQDIMPSWVYGNPMNAAMYLDIFDKNSDLAIFRFDKPSEGFHKLQNIKVPVLTIFAENDKATSTVKSNRALELIEANLNNSRSFEGRIISETDHQYRGKENALAEVIHNWAKKNI